MHDRCVTILLKGRGYDVMWEYDEFTGMFTKGIWKYLMHVQTACTRLFFPLTFKLPEDSNAAL